MNWARLILPIRFRFWIKWTGYENPSSENNIARNKTIDGKVEEIIQYTGRVKAG